MWNRVSVIAKPEHLPLDLAFLKARIRVDVSADDEDDDLLAFIDEAVAEIDGPRGIGFAMMEQTWALTLDRFAPSIVLAGAPVKRIESIKYFDADGAEQTVPPENYRLVAGINPARVVLQSGKSWPAVQATLGAVVVNYVLGEDDASNVPKDLIGAICMFVGHRYENREAVIVGTIATETPFGFQHVIEEYRQAWVA